MFRLSRFATAIAAVFIGTLVLLNVPLVASAQSVSNAQCHEDPDRCVEIDDLYTQFLNPAINLLSILVGLIVIAMIIVGGIQFSSAGGDPNKVQAAKKKISNALIALVTYLFLFAFLQWIVPGGIF